jgi:hypothetical protein
MYMYKCYGGKCWLHLQSIEVDEHAMNGDIAVPTSEGTAAVMLALSVTET